MLSNLSIPVNIVTLISAVVLIALLLVPRLAETARRFFARVRVMLLRFAGGMGNLIQSIWGRDDFLARRQELKKEAEREQVNRLRGLKGVVLNTDEITKIRSFVYQTYGITEPQNPTDTPTQFNGITGAWLKWRVDRAIRTEVKRQRKLKEQAPLSKEEIAQIQEAVNQTHGGEDPDVSRGLIASGWVRRIIYLLLALVCVGSDYVLVSTRAPILFGGGTTPPFLKALFGYLQIITGVLFVAIAALSGMLIQEHTSGLSPVVKIEPDIGQTEKKIKLSLAISMIVIDVIVVIFLTVGGVFQQYLQTQDLEVIYVVFIGTSILVAIGIFLAWTGLYQAVEGIGSLILGIVLGLPAILLAFVCAFIMAILALCDNFNRLLFGRKGTITIDVPEEQRNLTVVGFGAWGSDMAIGICQEIAKIYGSYVWLAGVYGPPQGNSNADEPDQGKAKQLEDTRVASHYVSVSSALRPEPAAKNLVNELTRYYGNTDAEKPLLWVVEGLELKSCLKVLQDLEEPKYAKSIKGLKLALVWRLPQTITQEYRAIAGQLWTWASKPASLLATTIVLEDASQIVKTLGGQRNRVLARSFASLLATDQSNGTTSFAAIISHMKTAGFLFAALQASSVGITTAPDAFKASHNRGFIVGMKGEINPLIAAGNTETIAEEAFEEQTYSTVTDTWPKKQEADWERLQHEVFVNIIVPFKLRREALLQAYEDETSRTLATNYCINANQVTYTSLRDEADKGIDISTADTIFAGEYFIHFTALRGVIDSGSGKGVGAAPKSLQLITAQSGSESRD